MKLIGLARQGNDADIRHTPNGDAVANISLAFNYGRKDEGGQRLTQWVDASLWGKRAESLIDYLKKGRLWYVEISDVHIETYEGRNGSGSKLVGRIENIEFAGGNEQQQGGQTQQRQQPNRGGRNDYANATGRALPAANNGSGDFIDDVPW